MSERKVLNKYYPPDFDPSKIPRLKRARNRQFNIRIMAPFNMRCNSCGDYIYKGKKFNSRQETVEDEDYLGLRIFRFYIKCPRCVSEITFKTDPEKTDYSLEGGATRNFEAAKTAEVLAQKALKEKEQDELNNPMKVLENRTEASRHEMDILETLQDLKELNTRNARLEHNQLIQLHTAYAENLGRLQEEEDEAFVQSVFGKPSADASGTIKRLCDDDDDDNDSADMRAEVGSSSGKRLKVAEKPTCILTEGSIDTTEKASMATTTATKVASGSWNKSVGGLSRKSSLSTLVKKKQTPRENGTEKNGTSLPGVPSGISGNDTQSATDTSGTEITPGTAICISSGAIAETTKSSAGALGMLGCYSDSENSNSD